jgi:hypothetical protein
MDGLVMLVRVDMGDADRHTIRKTSDRSREPQGYHLSFYEATNKRILKGSDRTTGCKWINKYSFAGVDLIVSSDVHSFVPTEDEKQKYASGKYDPYDLSPTLADDGGDEDIMMDVDASGNCADTNPDGSDKMIGLEFDDPAFNGECIKIRRTNFSISQEAAGGLGSNRDRNAGQVSSSNLDPEPSHTSHQSMTHAQAILLGNDQNPLIGCPC